MTTTEQQSQVEAFDVEAVNSKGYRSLYAARKKIHPKRAYGYFRTLKWWVMAITLGIYYITPWIRWDRGPHAPDQAVLVDLANRRFYFFFIEIWPQEFFYVAGLLVMAGIGLFLVTSTVGRAWCGYACPQTVWVDLFLVVERAIEGDRNARIKLDAAPMDASKIRKRVTKHVVWLLIAIATGGAWIFYFADAPTLLRDLVTGNAAFVAYATIAILAFTTYVFGGFMREQVCTYMCPWPRIQAAMLDEASLTVTYNDWRGEPRSRHAKKARAAGQAVGDCVDCNACVAVCPMGIDIRDGQQLECITCALCIDACNGVMSKLGREEGLIAYATLNHYNQNMALAGVADVPETPLGGEVVKAVTVDPTAVRTEDGKLKDGFVETTLRSVMRPRTAIYAGIWSAIGVAMLVVLLMRDRLDVNVLRDRNPVFVKLSDGAVRNGYELKVLNMLAKPRKFRIVLDGLSGGSMKIASSDAAGTNALSVVVPPDQLRAFKIYVRVPPENVVPGQSSFHFVVNEIGGEESSRYAAKFDAPE